MNLHNAEFIRSAASLADCPKDLLPQIAFDDFTKVDLRVAKILACEPIPKAKKPLEKNACLLMIGRAWII